MTDDAKKYLHYSPIDVWMFNAAPICNVGKYSDITTTRESVTCPDCNRILDALDLPAPVVDMFVPDLPICGVCETTHKPEEIVKMASGVDADTTWAEYLCMITGRTWIHLSHAAIAEAE